MPFTRERFCILIQLQAITICFSVLFRKVRVESQFCNVEETSQ